MQRYKCDIVVVGCGASGLATAVAALERKASVIVLERATVEDRGGNTRWTEALLRLDDPGSVPDHVVQAYLDNSSYYVEPDIVRETARDYDSWSALAKALPFVDPQLLGSFIDGIPETLEWLAKYGIRTHQSSYPLIPSVPILGIYGGGLALIETLCPIIETLGGKILYETTAVRLLQDDDNRVIGVKATDREHKSVLVEAGSVILCSGGFQGNPAMVVQYLGPNARYMRPVARGGWYDRGEGIRMALDADAAPAGDYAECHRQPVDPRSSVSEALVHAYPLGILVNREGERFVDEAPSDFQLYTEDPCRKINRQTAGIAYFIYDAQLEELPNWRRAIRSDQPPIEADTLAELAGMIKVPADRLERTIASFNQGCADGPIDVSKYDGRATAGVQPAKSNWSRPIRKPKFGCYPIISSNTFTCGGLRVTKDAQVVSASGVVIPGLYAAGETIGMIYGDYVGGTSVLRALVFGSRAGVHAASSIPGR